MPIYAYKCESCGFAKDVLQKISDQPLSECPSCAASTFRKQLTAAGFQLKGSGWYATDFKGGGNGADKADKADKAGDAAPAKSDGNTESKGDKTESKTKTAEPSASKKSEAAASSGSGS